MTTEEHVIDEELVEVAMQIILRAGEARTEIKHALNDLERFDYKNADLKLAKAKEFMTEAHRAQTNIIQGKLVEKKSTFTFICTCSRYSYDNIQRVKYNYVFSRNSKVYRI